MSGHLIYRVTDVPACTPFKVRDASGEPIKHVCLQIHAIEWEDGETWTGECEPVRLYHTGNVLSVEDEQEPVDRVPELLVEAEPRRREEA